jgi:hypothetical protein
MSDTQRYDAWPQECPFEDKNGEFVTYEDHIKIVKELEDKLAMAVEFIQEVRRNGDTRLASMAIATLAEIEGEKND